jgi:hypothetical protein
VPIADGESMLSWLAATALGVTGSPSAHCRPTLGLESRAGLLFEDRVAESLTGERG